MTKTLATTEAEATRFAELESVIAGGLQTFVEVGAALLEIRDIRLYRASHRTFEAYCRERWGMSRTHANRTIRAAEVAGVLAPIGVTPTNEAQARELSPLLADKAELAVTWQDLQAESDLTGRRIRQAVKDRRPASELVDVREFAPDAEGVCPTCHGTGRIPIGEL